jgi:hypothetical protein
MSHSCRRWDSWAFDRLQGGGTNGPVLRTFGCLSVPDRTIDRGNFGCLRFASGNQ